MSDILTWPEDWASVEQVAFYLKSNSLTSQQFLTGTRSVYGPLAQRWVCDAASTPSNDERLIRRMRSFISQAAGISGLVRRGDPSRRLPYRNTPAFLEQMPTPQARWSDGTTWQDGTLWADNVIPSSAVVGESTERGASTLLIQGLPALLQPALFAGDLLETRPDGDPASHGHLYELWKDANTDASGMTRVFIVPGLRAGVRYGDQVVFENAMTVFRMFDDEQGRMQLEAPMISRVGVQLVEVLP